MIHDDSCMEHWSDKFGSAERMSELFLRKDRLTGIVTISLFYIDIPMASKRIGFSTKLTRAEVDKKIELTEIFGPADLLAG